MVSSRGNDVIAQIPDPPAFLSFECLAVLEKHGHDDWRARMDALPVHADTSYFLLLDKQIDS